MTTFKIKTFKIAFNDAQDNEVYFIINKNFEGWDEATKYAELVLATTSDDCTTFTIYEL